MFSTSCQPFLALQTCDKMNTRVYWQQTLEKCVYIIMCLGLYEKAGWAARVPRSLSNTSEIPPVTGQEI